MREGPELIALAERIRSEIDAIDLALVRECERLRWRMEDHARMGGGPWSNAEVPWSNAEVGILGICVMCVADSRKAIDRLLCALRAPVPVLPEGDGAGNGG